MISRRWCFALLPVLLSACRVGQPFERPATEPPPAFKELSTDENWKVAAPSDQLSKGKWWELFGDRRLNELEEMVDVGNQNVKQAEALFRQARATVGVAHANYYPVVGVSPSVTQTDAGSNSGRTGGRTQTFSLPADVSWEPDLWGRVRLQVENAASNAQVSAADLENVRLSAQALLAIDYFSLAAADMQQSLLHDTIAAYEKNLQLTVDRFNGGVASRADITLAQTQLAGARAQSTDLRATRAQFEHAIAMLTGRPPASVSIPDSRIVSPPPLIPVALPSELLERRPDIAASERQVAAANATVGLAKAAFYPTLTLSASLGLVTTNLANLISYASRSWSTGATVNETLFEGGQRRAQLRGAQAAYDATVASYRQTVLSAFQEVEDSLASLRYLSEEAAQQQEAVTAAQQALSLELDRYKAGTDSYLSVITTQTIALSDQEAAITILQRRLNAAVTLIKSLGGGWDMSSLPTAEALRTPPAAPKK